MSIERKSQANKVCEMNDRMGIFTEGIKDKYAAYEAMLDWYYDYHTDQASRMYFEDYWGISVDQIDLERIQEEVMMKCNSELCGGNWWIGGDNDCYECDKRLDHRTKRKTFVLYF